MENGSLDLTIEEENAQINLINNFSIEDISSLWDKTLKEINKTTFFNLDKKQTIVNIINNFKLLIDVMVSPKHNGTII